MSATKRCLEPSPAVQPQAANKGLARKMSAWSATMRTFFLPLPIRCWRGVDGAGLFEDGAQLAGIQRLVQAQLSGDAVERGAMLGEQRNRAVVGPVDDAIDLLVDDGGRLLAVLARAGRQGSTREGVFALAEGDCTEALAHAPARHHLPGDGRYALQIVLRARRDAANRYLFGGTPAQSRHKLRLQVLFGVVVAIIERSVLCDAERLPARHNRHLRHGIDVLRQQAG